ncbi:MAG TPA: phosphoribosyl-ATP diphosphatase [Candidatus Limnocylindrales bacterium]|nr:phosphoribosyl-ATP diphosphatase [Candidatus Limnocylindrales bacterium]
MTLDQLYKIIKDRKENMPKNSYVTSLLLQGEDRVIQKIGEEATEVIIAAKNTNKEKFTSETSDLLFHIIILLNLKNVTLDDIFLELENRKSKQKKV